MDKSPLKRQLEWQPAAHSLMGLPLTHLRKAEVSDAWPLRGETVWAGERSVNGYTVF